VHWSRWIRAGTESVSFPFSVIELLLEQAEQGEMNGDFLSSMSG
jgi:hypothetical protein